ncbi:uncharacterized protein B0H18DRAFT_973138, partial [Fomitopsis serialis]|uniref:uncharacterized protein n=1 Tax=Fomitopsis serialis TaxID=139415 RepID=UPI0020088513
MRIVPWSVRGGRGRGFEVEEFTQVLEDHTTTLGDVWNKTTRKNAAKGECRNKDIAIKFVYDFGDEWEVHISIDCTKDGHYMFHGEPRDYPEVMVAKGAPPIEHASDLLPGVRGCKQEESLPLLFKLHFRPFVAGKVGSVTRKTELAIYNIEEDEAS